MAHTKNPAKNLIFLVAALSMADQSPASAWAKPAKYTNMRKDVACGIAKCAGGGAKGTETPEQCCQPTAQGACCGSTTYKEFRLQCRDACLRGARDEIARMATGTKQPKAPAVAPPSDAGGPPTADLLSPGTEN